MKIVILTLFALIAFIESAMRRSSVHNKWAKGAKEACKETCSGVKKMLVMKTTPHLYGYQEEQKALCICRSGNSIIKSFNWKGNKFNEFTDSGLEAALKKYYKEVPL